LEWWRGGSTALSGLHYDGTAEPDPSSDNGESENNGIDLLKYQGRAGKPVRPENSHCNG
jgi:hypothetical protein